MIVCLSHALKGLDVNTSGCIDGYDTVIASVGEQCIHPFATFENRILKVLIGTRTDNLLNYIIYLHK